MKPDLQRRIQRYGWDKAAPYYETGWEEQLWPAQERLLSTADLKPGEEVLDVSCGTGLVTFPAAEIIQPGGYILATDLSSGMIEYIHTQVNAQKIDNIACMQMDAEKLGLPDNNFDMVICSLGLMYFPNPAKAIKEMFRVLKPGGHAVALVWGERKHCGWAGIFPTVDRRVQSDVCPLFFQLGTDNALSQRFEEAGFEEVQSDRFSYDLHYQDGNQACVAAFSGGAVALTYQKFDEKTKEEAQEEYLDSIAQYRNDTAYNIPGEFVISTGAKPGHS